MSRFKYITLICGDLRNRAVFQAKEIVRFFESKRLKIFVSSDTAFFLKRTDLVTDITKMREKTDLVVVFGGDGTFLRAVSIFGQSGIPFFGINCGTVGFLNETDFADFKASIKMILKGRFRISYRMLLKGSVSGTEIKTYGLNEIALIRSSALKTLTLSCFVNDKRIGSFKADGIIVVTPTGSTAYSLSAGGPVVEPEMNAIIINPICPHTLAIRPLIVPSSSVIKLKWKGHKTDAILSADGQSNFSLTENVTVYVRKAERPLKLLTTYNYDFFGHLGQKLHWIG